MVWCPEVRFARASASTARFYYENAHAESSTEPTAVPVGLASFAGDVPSSRRFLGRDHENVVSWRGYSVGGHYAAHHAPDELVADLVG